MKKKKTHWDFLIAFMNASLIGKSPPIKFYNFFQNFGDIFYQYKKNIPHEKNWLAHNCLWLPIFFKNHTPILHGFVLQQSLNITLGTTHNNTYILQL
jgi:hypothetical protein